MLATSTSVHPLPKVTFVLQAIDHKGIGYQIIDFPELMWPQTGLESAEDRV